MKTKAMALVILTSWATSGTLRAEDAAFANDKDKTSYALGAYYGGDWKRREISASDLNFEEYLQGLKSALAGDKTKLSEPEVRDILNKFSQDLNAKQQEKRRVQGEKNKAEGAAFLTANKSKPGVKVTESGLQYLVETEGSGDSPKPEDTVSVKYRGTLIDGTEFDSSAKTPNGIAKFRATAVIKGWTEALTHMKPGAKWKLFIPAELAYGEQVRPPHIGPNATLLFDLELLSAEAPPPPAAPPAPLTSDIIKVPSLEEMKKGAKIETIKAEDVEKLQKK